MKKLHIIHDDDQFHFVVEAEPIAPALFPAALSDAPPSSHTSTGPNKNAELDWISGVDFSGKIAAQSFWTWNQDPSPTHNPLQFNGSSDAEKWTDGIPRLGTVAGTPGGKIAVFIDSQWSSEARAALVDGFRLWSAVANIQFAFVGKESDAAITVFNQATDDGAGGDAPSLYPVGGTIGGHRLHAIHTATINLLDPSNPIGGGFSGGNDKGYSWTTLLHEIGHALGLGHAGPYNGTSGWKAEYQYSQYDSWLYSIMSYNNPNPAGSNPYPETVDPNLDWSRQYPTTWMPLDILAAQRLYGNATDTPLSGGQTFGFHCNIKGVIKKFFDFGVITNPVLGSNDPVWHPVLTIWDAGAGNTLDLSGFDTPSVIRLQPGSYSSCDGITDNIAIADFTKVDTAIGGSGNDIFYSNSDGDRLVGGLGNDEYHVTGTHDTIVEKPDQGYDKVIVSEAKNTSIDGTTINVRNVELLQLSGRFTEPATVVCNQLASVALSPSANHLTLDVNHSQEGLVITPAGGGALIKLVIDSGVNLWSIHDGFSFGLGIGISESDFAAHHDKIDLTSLSIAAILGNPHNIGTTDVDVGDGIYLVAPDTNVSFGDDQHLDVHPGSWFVAKIAGDSALYGPVFDITGENAEQHSTLLQSNDFLY